MKRAWAAIATIGGLALVVALYTRGDLPYVGLFEADQPHAHGHDDVVVRVEQSPGMGTLGSFFSRAPDLVVAGDGTAYAGTEVASAGIVEPVLTFRIGESGVQSLLKRAAHDGLLADHAAYPSPDGVMDAGTTDVLLATSRGTWTHSAYALQGGWDPTARGHLGDFVSAAMGLADDANGTPYAPTALRMLATLADPKAPDEAAAWPTGTGIDLAAVGQCRVVTSPTAIGQLTSDDHRYYTQRGQTYEVAAAVWLPGDSCWS